MKYQKQCRKSPNQENRDNWHKAPESQPPQKWRRVIPPPFFPEPLAKRFGGTWWCAVGFPQVAHLARWIHVGQAVGYLASCCVSHNLWITISNTWLTVRSTVSTGTSRRIACNLTLKMSYRLANRATSQSECLRQTDQWFNVDSWVTQQLHACNSQNRISTLERKEIGFWGSFNNGVQKEKSNAGQNCLWTTIAASPMRFVTLAPKTISSAQPTWQLLRPFHCNLKPSHVHYITLQ